MESQNLYESITGNLDYKIEELRLNQNVGLGVLGGFLGCLIGAIIWAAVTVITDFQIGWMAVGVGFIVGKSVGYCGKGIDSHFGIIGATFSLIGCLLGNLLATFIIISRVEGIALFELLNYINVQVIFEIFKFTFSPMDLVFYALAVYEGYKFSIKSVNINDLEQPVSSEHLI
ncbi:hypothetical protein R9X47_24145 [Wukongibacter baidiensis]|uniref:hypothetical protein n=1 Tax=Wukongibacter baidiensis TaxID=1723361 RepID=UPI003D7FE2CD